MSAKVREACVWALVAFVARVGSSAFVAITTALPAPTTPLSIPFTIAMWYCCTLLTTTTTTTSNCMISHAPCQSAIDSTTRFHSISHWLLTVMFTSSLIHSLTQSSGHSISYSLQNNLNYFCCGCVTKQCWSATITFFESTLVILYRDLLPLLCSFNNNTTITSCFFCWISLLFNESSHLILYYDSSRCDFFIKTRVMHLL